MFLTNSEHLFNNWFSLLFSRFAILRHLSEADADADADAGADADADGVTPSATAAAADPVAAESDEHDEPTSVRALFIYGHFFVVIFPTLAPKVCHFHRAPLK